MLNCGSRTSIVVKSLSEQSLLSGQMDCVLISLIHSRLYDFNTKYVAKFFTRAKFKVRDVELLETFHRINKRDAEVLVEEFEKGMM